MYKRQGLAAAFRRAFGGETITDGTTSPAVAPPDQMFVGSGDTRMRQAALTPSRLDFPEPENPYKGLYAFEEADSADFFGRRDLVEQLLGRLGQEDPIGQRFIAVVGPSGSGKSSVIKAGVIPALRDNKVEGTADWFIVEMTPDVHPLEELEAALLRVAVNPPESLLSQLREDERGLIRAVKRVLPADDRIELVLFIDQFEEAFTQVADEDERAQFLSVLAAAVRDPRSRLRLVITLRADFYDRPLLYQDFGSLLRDHTEVALPLSREELEESIVQPANQVGVNVQPELVAAIIADVVEQPGMLPLLQYALTELFERRKGREMTLQAYQESGGVQGALARRAEDLFSQFDAESQDATRQLFLRLVTIGEGTEDTRRRVLRSRLLSVDERLEPIIQMYGKARLLTFDRDSETREPTIEVAHEALIRQWGRLRDWLDNSRDDLRQQRRVARSAQDWAVSGHDPSFLATGFRLDQLEQWMESTDFILSNEEQAFLDASVAKSQEAEAVEAARRAREEALEERSQRILRALAVVFLGAAVVAAVLAFLAFQSGQAAERQAIVNRSLTLATGAQLALADDDTDQAIVLALAANDIEAPPSQARRSLVEAGFAPGTRRVYSGHEGRIFGVAVAPAGQRIVTSAGDGRLMLWSRASGEMARIYEGHQDTVFEAVFSNDGRQILSGGADGKVILWDVERDTASLTIDAHEDVVRDVALSPNTRLAASGSADGTAVIWDLSSGEALHTLTGHSDQVFAVGFSPDGSTLATGSQDATIILWDVETGEQLAVWADHSGRINDLAFSPDGEWLVSAAGGDNALFVWEVSSGVVLRRIFGHADQPYAVVFGPDGDVILSGSQDGSTRVWNANTGAQIQRFLGHAGGVESVAFSPDGKSVFSGGQDNVLREWDLTSGAELFRFTEHSVTIYGTAFHPNGRFAASGAWDTTVVIYDTQSGRAVRRFGQIDNTDPAVGHTNWITDIEFTADGTGVVTGSYDGAVILWDFETGELLRRFEGHDNRIWDIAVSPDGTRAISGSQDQTAIIWDLNTGDQLVRLEGQVGWIRGVDFSPDGTRVLTGAGESQTVVEWDAFTGEMIQTLTGHEEWLWEVVYFSDGQRALSSASDGEFILWDLESGQRIRSFIGHDGPLTNFALYPDEMLVATASSDTTIRVWDIESGLEIRRFTGHSGTVWGLALSPDGETAITGSSDATVRVWDINFTQDELIEWVQENRYVREPTCLERQEYQIAPLCED
ncbi:MAG: hypothetical protein GYB68_11940 [Chloroflexi bacterium]|nr:hypothetical protein [Chloroflexota bacterium]